VDPTAQPNLPTENKTDTSPPQASSTLNTIRSNFAHAAMTADTEAPSAKPDQVASGLPEMKSALLHDVAVKRLEYQDRLFDTLNTRAGAVFGFSTFVLSACGVILGRLEPYPRIRVLFGACCILIYAFMTYACWRAFKVEGVKTLPDPAPYYQQHLDGQPDAVVRYELFGGYVKAYQENEPLVERKAESLGHAINALVALVFGMILGAISPELYSLAHWFFSTP
jgi:hypothetical protein